MWACRGTQAVNLNNVENLSVQDKAIHIAFRSDVAWDWVFESKEVALASFTTLLIQMKMNDEAVTVMEE